MITVVRPGTELHEAGLFVKGEVLNVDLTEGLVDSRWLPHHLPRVMEDRLRHDRHLVVTIRAGM